MQISTSANQSMWYTMLTKQNTKVWSFYYKAENTFDKVQHPFLIKMLNKVGGEGMCLNIIKTVSDKPTVNFILNGKKFRAFPLKSGIGKDLYSHHLYLA